MSEAEPTLEVSYEDKKQVRNPWVSAASSDNVGNESDDSVTSPAPISKPPGKDNQKKAKRKEMQGPTGVKLSSATKQFIEGRREATTEETVQMRLLFEKQADLKQERFEIELMMEDHNKEQADLKQERFEIEFMMKDLNKYTPNRKKYLRGKQKEILQRHAARNIFENDDA